MIGDGDFVILKRDGYMRVVQARTKGRPIVLDKKKFYLDNIIGKPYGSTFDVDQKSGQLIQRKQGFTVEDVDVETSSGVDNRNLISANEENQVLNKDSIHALKKDGLSGEEVMAELIKNSATFNQKTKFSQEKWIKKKKKRHMHTYTILKPCTRLIAEMYYQRDPSKICFLRMDSLAQILTHGNIQASSKVLLVETCQGLLAGAILDRLSDDGCLTQLFTGTNPMKGRNAFDDFSFTKETQKKRMKLYPLSHMHEISTFGKQKSRSQSCGDRASPPDKKQKLDEQSTDVTPDVLPDALPDVLPDTLPDSAHSNESNRSDVAPTRVGLDEPEDSTQNIPIHLKERESSRKYLESNLFDVLIVAVKYQPTELVLHLLKLIKLSRPVVVYHQYKEPLVELFVQLKERGGLVNLRLSESWLRGIQVLPDRTHPSVLMSGTSGYILSGTTVEK